MRTLLPILLLLTVVPPLKMSAQELPHDNRTISIRLFGTDAEPIAHESGEIRFIDPGKIIPEEEHYSTRYNSYFTRTFYLPDGEFAFDSFPVDLEINHNRKRMTLRLDADVDSIRFREGVYNVPWRFEPLFAMMGLNGTRVVGKGIGCFEVSDYRREPVWPAVRTDQLKPFRFDTIRGKESEPLYPLSAIGTGIWDWQRRTLFSAATPSGGGMPCTLYVSRDGREFTPHPMTMQSQSVIRLFFVDSLNGWAVVDTGVYRLRQYVVQRTTDGGTNWSIDHDLTSLGVIDAGPRDRKRAWFLGQRLTGNEKRDGVLTLYTGSNEGTGLSRVEWPVRFDSRIIGIPYDRITPELVSTGEDWIHLYNPGDTVNRSQWISLQDGDVADVPGRATTLHTAPDGTGWMIVTDAYPPSPIQPYRSGWNRFSRSYLLRISADYRSIRPLLSSGYPLQSVAFADASTGVVAGETFLLLTIDAGKSWRYVPYDTVWSHWGEMKGLWGPDITPFWPNADTLRMVYPDGYLDLAIDDLPPVRDCGEMLEEEYQGEDIE